MKNIIFKKICPIAAWLLIWQAVAVIIHNKVLLAGPVETFLALVRMAPTADFQQSVLNTTLRILAGFVIGSCLGMVFSFLAYYKEAFKIFMSPFVTALKSIPVASFVILLLIWFGSGNISTIICAIVVFPILYLNTLEGLMSTDVKLLEMAKVYRMPEIRTVRYIFLPRLVPFFRSAFKLAIGMSFKSGIAAEVIGQPLHTIGNGLYQAKIYLETGELFAWTAVVIFISFVCERLMMLVVDLIGGKRA